MKPHCTNTSGIKSRPVVIILGYFQKQSMSYEVKNNVRLIGTMLCTIPQYQSQKVFHSVCIQRKH